MTVSAVIVQARMGSSRLPGKVMKRLAGRTVLDHVFDRCHAVANADIVCCATTEAAADDVVAAEAARCGATVFRGLETDVLARYAGAAKAVSADVVLRMTSDCPLFDPALGTAVLALRRDRNVDYAANNLRPGWPHGLDCEAFTADVLFRAAREAADPFEREHVTPWIRSHPDIRRANLDGPGGKTAAWRWTLDYPEDLLFFDALFEHLPPAPARPEMDEVLAVLDHHPHIGALNAMHRGASRPRTQSP